MHPKIGRQQYGGSRKSGQEAFDRIAMAYANAPRAKGRTEVDDMRLLREMARLRVRRPEWSLHRAAQHVAERVIAEDDWGDRPIRVTAHSLREKLKRDFRKRSLELMRQAQAEARRSENARAPVRASSVVQGRLVLEPTTRAIDDAVRSAQRTLDRLPRRMRDENFTAREFERWERESKLWAASKKANADARRRLHEVCEFWSSAL